MSNRSEDPRKILAASLLRRLVDLSNVGATLEDWNDAFAEVVSNVAIRLRPKFGGVEQRWVESAAASAMRTVLRRAQNASSETTPRLRPSGPDALLGLLVLIAFDKVYEKKRRDNVEESPVASTAEREDEEQERLMTESIRDEMERQLGIMLARSHLLGGGQEAQVYRLLLKRKLEIEDRSYERIRELTGVTAYTMKKARTAVDEYAPGLITDARRVLDNLAQRIRAGS